LVDRTIAGAFAAHAVAFGVLEIIRPMIEVVPLEEAPQAYAKMMRNETRFRMVLGTGP